MRFRFIQGHAARFSVQRMCRLLGVSRSGYYAWRKRKPSSRELANHNLMKKIRKIYEESEQIYGYRKVHSQVCNQIHCSVNRVARLMRLAGMRSRRIRRYRATTQSQHKQPVAPNLLAQEFIATAPNQKWVSDITYIHTDEGWLYLAAILDLYSRYVVGWAMASHLADMLTIRALKMALRRRQPLPELLHHSDRGRQYASKDYRSLLMQAKAVLSMSRTGNVYDNAPMESFYASLKMERVQYRRYRTRREAKADIFHYIEVFYNRQRVHAALGYLSPVEFELLSMTP